jgi:hypothetical protein
MGDTLWSLRLSSPSFIEAASRAIGCRVPAMNRLPTDPKGVRDLFPSDAPRTSVLYGGFRDHLSEPLEVGNGAEHSERRLGVLQVPKSVVKLGELVLVEPRHTRMMTT